jgi:transcriptional regulator with XRE-family HTH domain
MRAAIFPSMDLRPEQCRAARALLGISQGDLAEMSGVSKRALAGFEAKMSQLIPANRTVIRQALEKAGVVFFDDDGPGVQLRPKKRRK